MRKIVLGEDRIITAIGLYCVSGIGFRIIDLIYRIYITSIILSPIPIRWIGLFYECRIDSKVIKT